MDVSGVDLNNPKTSAERFCRGNAIITSSSAACALAFSWAGAKYSWSSVNVLAPLILGIVGIGIFLFYEHRYATHPIVCFPISSLLGVELIAVNQVPFSLLSNRTSLSGYVVSLRGYHRLKYCE